MPLIPPKGPINPLATPRVAAIMTTIASDPIQVQVAVDSVQSAATHAGVAIELICVLNDNRRNLPDLSGCRLVTTDYNLGYAGGLALARSLVDADFLWVIQDDMTVPEHALSAMLDNLRIRPEAGVFSPLVSVAANQGIAHLRAGLISANGDMQTPYPILINLANQGAKIPELNWAALAGALISSRVWDEVDGPDVNFFPLQYVDVDFCYRITAAGHPIVVVSEVQIAHQLAGSSAGLLKRYLNVKSRQRFREKHGHGGHSESTTAHNTERLDPPAALVAQIAKVASLDYVDLARFANQEINLLLAELNQLSPREIHDDVEARLAVATQQLRIRSELAAIQNSFSWRITAPLRKIGALFTAKRAS